MLLDQPVALVPVDQSIVLVLVDDGVVVGARRRFEGGVLGETGRRGRARRRAENGGHHAGQSA